MFKFPAVPVLRRLWLALLPAVLCSAAPLWAQSRVAIISDRTAQQHGLSRAWMSQVQLDRTLDKLQNLILDLPDEPEIPPPTKAKEGEKAYEKPKTDEKEALPATEEPET